MSLISDHIEEMILELLETYDGTAKFKRGLLAEELNCVPSQITYVLKTRFQEKQGFQIESRRGEGGYILVRRLIDDPSTQALKHFVFALDDALSENEARVLLKNILASGQISAEAASLMQAVSHALLDLDFTKKDEENLRAKLLKAMLLDQLT